MKISKSLLALILIASFSLGYHFKAEPRQFSKLASSDVILANTKQEVLSFDRFNEIFNFINTHFVYLEELEAKDLEDKIVKGLVAGLNDQHSSYFNAEESKMFMDNLDKNLVGIGAELTVKDGLIYVVTPLVSSPAEKAGLQPDDVIFSVDGEDITSLNLYAVIQKIRGEVGTSVTLGILREEQDPFEVSIIRQVINLDSVSHEKLEDDLFYIRINQFSDDTNREFQAAATQALLSKPKGIILDLRFNGGGYLDSAVEILGEFLDKNQVAVATHKKSQAKQATQYTKGPARLKGIPLTILLNKGSASASEILAGTLQDYGVATIIGEQSYGKGSVQEVIPFADGATLKLTVAKWLTAKGRDIDKFGLEPDIKISISEEDVQNNFDRQLDEAKKYLSNLVIANN